MTIEHYTPYELRLWSIQVRRRDGPRCKFCNQFAKRQAHHLYDKSTYPELALVLENGISLCYASDSNNCHGQFHNRWMGGTAVSCTSDDWREFVEHHAWSRRLIATELLTPIPKLERNLKRLVK